MTQFFDKPGYAYVENDELYMREVSLMKLENNPDCMRDFVKPGYWVKIGSPTINDLFAANCNLLTTHLQARRRYDDTPLPFDAGAKRYEPAPEPQTRPVKKRKR